MDSLTFIPLKDWGFGMGERMVISGPCSAETREQVLETARLVAKQNVQVLRAGIWKPRTRPNSFEGIGSEGLSWLAEAGRETGLPTCVEVANVKHVYECLKAGVDMLWIGARTTTNPFAVQEIADVIKGMDIPVMVKNPVNPDLELWIGGIERIYQAGIRRIAAIHRGFSSYGKSKYRNQPQWEIPIELRRRYPDMPILCDPSHICGSRDLIASVAQKSMDLNFNGLMIEAHINPDVAWSDAKQQVTPERLGQILNELVYRKPQSDDPAFINQLSLLRDQIDELDNQMVDLLASRMKVSRQIGHYKKENGITILQAARWSDIIKDRLQAAVAKGLSEDIMNEILQMIHKESIRQQTLVMNSQEVKS